jgi:hypothetical protein
MSKLALCFSGQYASDYQKDNSAYGRIANSLRKSGLKVSTELHEEGSQVKMDITTSDLVLLKSGISMLFGSGVTPCYVLSPEGEQGSSRDAYKVLRDFLPDYGYKLDQEKLHRNFNRIFNLPLADMLTSQIKISRRS